MDRDLIGQMDVEVDKQTAEIGKVLTILHILGITVTLTPTPDETEECFA